MEYISILLFTVLCLAGYWVGTRIETHVRTEHPVVWFALGFPAASAFRVQPQDEGRYAKAQLALFRLLWNKDGIFSYDLHLARLRKIFLAIVILVLMNASAMALQFIYSAGRLGGA